ncbi:MAG: esterase/lipase family protein [Myxococcota bacterium]
MVRRAAIALALAATLAACAGPPIGVRRVDVGTVHRELTSNVLSTGEPSAPTVQVLHRQGLFERWRSDPDAVLAQLHRDLAPEADEARLFALAELSFQRGERQRDRARLLAAAVYAYAFLFPGGRGTPPGPFDPRLRVASDIYNRALTGGLLATGSDAETYQIELGERALPFGTLTIDRAAPVFAWADHELIGFESAADFQVRGLRNRYRSRGLGAPLAATMSVRPIDAERRPSTRRIPSGYRVSATALLRIDDPRAGIASGALHGTLSMHTRDDADEVTIDGRVVPIEFETTATLALGLHDSELWEFERRGFRSGDWRPFGTADLPDGLMQLQPYRPGRIPLVFVHGTASSPARWAEMINELGNDPRLVQRYQFWLFMYNTGNPIALSGALLREALTSARNELDPEGEDAALDRMVVVGHSQGGLLAKLVVVDSGDDFWAPISDVPPEELELEPGTVELLRRALFFEAVPSVERVVFVCTPHRGSYLTLTRIAGFRPARWAAGLIELPGQMLDATVDLVSLNQDRRIRRSIDGIPTSIDNMTPGNPFLKTLVGRPLRDGVAAHSIIAVQGDGPAEEGSDGVVRYGSAHLEGVDSERVVRSGHSAQGHPDTIEEVRRILLEHAAREPVEQP